MFRSLLDFLNVRPEERLQVMLMLGAGFFMGIFFATYSVVAESLFLSTLGNELNKAFLVSGALGIVACLIFSWAQNQLKFSNLTVSAIVSVVAITSFFYVAYHFGPVEYRKPVIFFMFCMTGPITAVLLLSYWGTFGRLFNFKQSKRIIGWIDTGQLVAVILANVLIPLTAGLFPSTDSYLIVCCLAIIASAVHFIIISIRFPLVKNDPAEFGPEVKKETRLVRVVTDPYTKLMSVFLIVSMVTLIFGQFTFQELIKVQYPNQRELTDFLAYFNATIYVLSFVMQTFVNDKIVSNYGIRVALLILPLIVAVFAVSASFTGLVFGYSPELAPDKFIYFFLFIALIRLFNNMIRDSLENPMFKLLFVPLDSRLRFGVQSKVEGVINETGRFTAGALIFVFALIPGFQIIWMPILLVVLMGLYFVTVNQLYAGYKSKIRSKLETAEVSAEKLEIGFGPIIKKLESKLESNSTNSAVFAYKLLEKIDGSNVGSWVNTLMRNPHSEIQEFAQRKANELKGLSVSDRYIIRYDRNKSEVSDKNLLTKNELEMIIHSGGDITKSRILRLTRSPEPGDRQYAAELLLHSSVEENTSFLIELLNDPDIKVRNTAIKTAVKKNSTEVILALIENLNNPVYANQAMNSLTLIGGKALSLLESAFYRTGQSTATLIHIVQVIGRIGGQRGKDLLWNKIDYPDKVVVSRVLLAMGESGFKAGISQVSRIKFAIENDIGDISWNLQAIQELEKGGISFVIETAIRSEIANDVNHVYMLLAMLYDTRSIQLVKENIESGTVEGTAFAIELLDVFLSEQLKQRVIPVLDELSDTERINRLEVFYPRIALDDRLVLKFLINRDFTQTSRWTKACVIYQVGLQKVPEFTLDLVAQMFNPDLLIRQTAAWSLLQIDPDQYHLHSGRLGEDAKRELDAVLAPAREGEARKMQFDKILFLSKIDIFKGLPGLALSFVADMAEVEVLKANKSLSLDDNVNNYFFVVFEGEIDSYYQGKHQRTITPGTFIGEQISRSGIVNSSQLMAKEGEAVLLKISKDQLYGLLSENVRLAERVLDYA
ncbi:MAG: hypothetical protein K2U26_11400 [Cyclobacteriaceae bacterium]|nr:hypothetical protein [Cyclobacteriaceae bacterium]